MNLTPVNKNLFSSFYTLYKLLHGPKTKEDQLKQLFKDLFTPKLLHNPRPSYSLISLHFLLSHIAHFDKSIILPFFPLQI